LRRKRRWKKVFQTHSGGKSTTAKRLSCGRGGKANVKTAVQERGGGGETGGEKKRQRFTTKFEGVREEQLTPSRGDN